MGYETSHYIQMEQDTINKFKEDVKKHYLVISRINPKTRQELIDFANIDFCGDYGQVLYHIWEQFKEYQFMKATMFGNVEIKLNHIIELLNTENKIEDKGIKLLSGKILMKGGSKE
jgi:hypothetical protein